MNEKKYLNWFNKIGYGSGDIAGNVVYALAIPAMLCSIAGGALGSKLALMRGAKESLAAQSNRTIKVAAAKSSKMNSPVYASALGLADLVFDSIEQHDDDSGPMLSRVKNLFRGKNA